ncbi:hypothetical protein VKT23_002860 [Stygiomarasmius scandens]|uniref:DUF6534 domain-containing protein n=1 Tax=Marasmiellus scandens TaxID=2682957 RepID=A0ABR1JW66_9AGAR
MGLFDNVIGTLVIATWLSCALWMLEVVGAYTYYGPKGTASKDTIYLRITVAAVITVDTLNLAIACLDTYEFAVSHYGQPSYLMKEHWRATFWLISGQFVGAVVQTFLAYRYIRLSKDWYIGTILMLLILIALGANIASAILTMRWPDYSQRTLLEKPVNVWLVVNVGADVAIASAMVYRLWRGQNGFNLRLDSILYRLIANTIQTGTLTSLFAMGGLVAYLAQPASNVSSLLFWVLNRLYVITLLFTLNLRDSLRRLDNISTHNNTQSGNTSDLVFSRSKEVSQIRSSLDFDNV